MTREEAIEVYHGLINTKIKEAFEFFVPELRESEDERIRKIIRLTLIASEDELSDFYKVHNTSRKECTDWLEKQKEQKPLSTEETELNSIAFLEQLGYTCVPPGAEQKPADDEAKAIAYREYERGRESGLRDGQKYVLDNVESYGLCKPAEWSEEDEKMVRFYEADYNNQIGDMSMKDVIDMRLKFKDWLVNRLKSLRPSWKPSEEQMQYLLAVINDPNNAGAESCHLILESLYNDLKEL